MLTAVGTPMVTTLTVGSIASLPQPPRPEPKLPPPSGRSRPHQLKDSDIPQRTKFEFDDIKDAMAAFAMGEFLVVMDDENRENEGDLIVAADGVTTEQMAWMIKHTSGYICIALPEETLEDLEIPMMVEHNEDRNRTAYTVTVDYKHGTTTGISAHDRALTARALAHPATIPTDFSRPGHLVPLRAHPNGVLSRRGHTEAGLDLCELTGHEPAGLLCEIVNDDEEGTMARRDECRAFADRWGVKMISIQMLVEWRERKEREERAKSGKKEGKNAGKRRSMKPQPRAEEIKVVEQEEDPKEQAEPKEEVEPKDEVEPKAGNEEEVKVEEKEKEEVVAKEEVAPVEKEEVEKEEVEKEETKKEETKEEEEEAWEEAPEDENKQEA
ncbi:uncharacterized protein STEHIDRAFT_78886 [Stereum hirsutum FP-91666 SS1]|uniref:uncharacterized protein n=1 Tax=Stereum hirsutum (strain FP-91666) TaxID=721885 RepID=UPI000440C9E2|nr:uncharacterized protein STEHIDRAFT_78886 [Stereum hirsutum FP-91666 SS1]EIM86421.1 hypothetical protein STEHIDRAFT_78886 [Stereum hirsutum FP-91666 SS1]